MCKPTTIKPIEHRKELRSVHKKATTFFGFLFLGLAIFFPIFVSEQIGGWTRKYTSPIYFDASKIPDMTGKVALVTGANTGIGYHTALELVRNGAEVILTSRSVTKGQAAMKNIEQDIKKTNKEDFDIKMTLLQLDLASLESVEQFALEFEKLNKPLHILVLNAGIMKSPGQEFVGTEMRYGFETTKDGFESHIGVNHIGHFYLTKLLSKKLKASAPSRVVSVASVSEGQSYKEGFRFDEWMPENGLIPDAYEDGTAYGQSKLANVMFANELSSTVFKDTGVTAYSLHPGVIRTELGRYMEGEMFVSFKGKGWMEDLAKAFADALFSLPTFNAQDGALTQLHVATAPAEDLVNGGLYHPIGSHVTPLHPQGSNKDLQRRLFAETEAIIERVIGKNLKLEW